MNIGRAALWGLVWVLCNGLLAGCGPDTIFLRPGLDTPALHVANGDTLLKQNKLDAALREFNRALVLEPNYAPALIGLGKIWGLRGDSEKGLAAMQKAQAVARGESERRAVSEGFAFLEALEHPPAGEAAP